MDATPWHQRVRLYDAGEATVREKRRRSRNAEFRGTPSLRAAPWLTSARLRDGQGVGPHQRGHHLGAPLLRLYWQGGWRVGPHQRGHHLGAPLLRLFLRLVATRRAPLLALLEAALTVGLRKLAQPRRLCEGEVGLGSR
jgi:hypothetical protein